ncbi:LPXTG cell wall anchor domain-containing protein [Kordiimonas sp.]
MKTDTRALSFMGLGAALIGLGYLYQFFRRKDRVGADSDDRSNQFKL